MQSQKKGAKKRKEAGNGRGSEAEKRREEFRKRKQKNGKRFPEENKKRRKRFPDHKIEKFITIKREKTYSRTETGRRKVLIRYWIIM